MSPTSLSGPPRFLLVEDDDDHAELIKRALATQAGPPIIRRVDDGEAALAYLSAATSSGSAATGNGTDASAAVPKNVKAKTDANDHWQPDVILLDLNLPKFSGHEVLAALKSNDGLREIPVIVLTSSDADVDRHEAYKNHVNSYLVKPVDFNRFRSLVHEMYSYWTCCNQPPPKRTAS